jgi:hypothetical protein
MLKANRLLAIIILFFFAVIMWSCGGGGGGGSSGGGTPPPSVTEPTPIVIPTITTDSSGNATTQISGSTQLSVTINDVSSGSPNPISALKVDVVTNQTDYYILISDPTLTIPPIPIAFNMNAISSTAQQSIKSSDLIIIQSTDFISCGLQAASAILTYTVSIIGNEIRVVANILTGGKLLEAALSAPIVIEGNANYQSLNEVIQNGENICQQCSLNEATKQMEARFNIVSGVISLSTIALAAIAPPAALGSKIAGVLVSSGKLLLQLESVVYCFYGYTDNDKFDWYLKFGVLTPVPVQTGQQNKSPVISSVTANPSSVNPNGTSTITCNASDPDGDVLSSSSYVWTKTGGSISGSGSTVTWTAPSTAGNYTVTCTVSDSKGGSASKGVNITVTESTVPLSITTTSLSSGTVGVSYPATTLSATGGKSPYSWSIISGNLSSSGLSMSPSGVISGTPTTAGTYTFTVKVTDTSSPQQTASKALSIVINPPATYSISGRVTLNGSGLSGVTMTLTGTGSTTTTTGSDGTYTFTGAQNGSYTLTASKTGYSFTPSSIPVTVNNANVTGQDFTATQTTGGILSVTPSDGLTSSGPQGGPFSPSSKTYTLSNSGVSSINWTASKGQNWVNLSSTNGSLAAGASTSVTVSINNNANSLSANNYVDLVTFNNTTNSNGNTTRTVNLVVTSSTPTITVGPPSLSFGNVQVGTCSSYPFTIQHVSGTGSASGTVSANPNPPFSITSGGSFSVSNGSAANVTVQFCPTSSGTFNGSATVSSSATFTGTNTVALTGTGYNSCNYSILPASQSFGSSGGSGSVSVTTSSGCSWTASSSYSWITITSGSSGSVSGTVNYSVASNSSTSSRTGTMTVAGQTFTVTQSGAPASSCSEVEPNDLSSQANPLTLNVGCTGKISSSTDKDWFDIYVSSGTTISFTLTVPTGLDYDMALYGPDSSNPSQHWLKESTNPAGQNETINYTTTATGYFAVQIYGYQGAYSTTSAYTITRSQ